MKPKILVSACLMGHPVKYNGTLVPVHERLKELNDKGLIIPFCPEVEGGLPVPRPPAEIKGGDGSAVLCNRTKVVRCDGVDVTTSFILGASKTADLVKTHHISLAIMKDGSPSCGSTRIYDGTFTGTGIPGKGVTATLLEIMGVRIFTESEIETLIDDLFSTY
jgi:uncharacterized protein YbbK (DUF523 family)